MESTLPAIAFSALIIAQCTAVIFLQTDRHGDFSRPHRDRVGPGSASLVDGLKRRQVMFTSRKFSEKATVVVAGLLLLAASGFVWSNSRPTSSDAVSEARAAAASAISPMDLMFKHSRRLPTENWDSF